MPNKTLILANGQQQDFILHEVPGDGDCGYSAFAAWLNLKKKVIIPENSGSLRHKVANYINEHWDDVWDHAEPNTKLKDFVKLEITNRQKSYNDFSQAKHGVDFNIETDSDDAIKTKYCTLVAEPKKLWIDHLEFAVLRKIFAEKIFIVNILGQTQEGGSLENNPAATEDAFYAEYTGNHYNLLINIKDYLANSWLKIIKQDNTLLELIAARVGKDAKILQNQQEEAIAAIWAYLNSVTKERLAEFYQELSKFVKKEANMPVRSYKPAAINNETDMFSVVATILQLVSSDVFLEKFTNLAILWRKIVVMLNPEVELDSTETSGCYATYGEYKEIFELAQGPGRKFYRNLLREADKGAKLTGDQFLNKFLHTLKHDVQQLFSKNGHTICTALEQKVLRQDSNFTNNIKCNLENAFKLYNKEHKDKAALINVAITYAQTLKTKIDQLKQEIINASTTDEAKNDLFQQLQYERVKLVHFTLKMQAFSKGETLTNQKSFRASFKKYLDKLSAVKEIVQAKEELRLIQISCFSKYNINPGGIFNLFKDHNCYKPLHVETKFEQDRILKLETRKTYLLQEIKNLSQRAKIYKEEYVPMSSNSYDMLDSLTTQLQDAENKINAIDIPNNLTEKQYNEMLSDIVFKEELIARFKNTVTAWYNKYTDDNLPPHAHAHAHAHAAKAKPQAPEGAHHLTNRL